MWRRFPLINSFAAFFISWWLWMWTFVYVGGWLTGELHNPISLSGLYLSPLFGLLTAVFLYLRLAKRG